MSSRAGRTVARRYAAVVLLTAGLVVAPGAPAQPRGSAPLPIELDAYVGSAPEGVKPDYTWVVAYGAHRYTLQVTRLFVRNGRTSEMELNEAVKSYAVTFTLAGTREALPALTKAPTGRFLTLRANVRFSGGTRYLIVDSVKSLPTPREGS